MSYRQAGRHAGAILAGLTVAISLSLPAAADDSAAHAIADKFSGAPEERRSKEARRAAERQRLKIEAEARERAERERRAAERARAEELEMLAKARRESEERAALERRQREEAEIRERRRAEETARLAAEAEARKVAAERAAREAEERRLAQERRDRERLAAEAEARRIEETRKADAERAAREAEEQRLAEEQLQRLEAEREAEARRIVEKHNRAREAREQNAQETQETVKPAPPPAQTAYRDEHQWRIPHRQQGGEKPADTRATVLLVMEPGSRGIRKDAPTADPVLCSGLVCYVSMGPGNLSHAFMRSAVLGPINTLGRRAWACKHKLGCVFRSVDMSSGRVTFQPVDLRIMRHDRRESLTAELDTTCEVDAGRLTCGKPIRAASWRAWIVPESVAREAGPAVLEAAVEAGLPDTRSALWR